MPASNEMYNNEAEALTLASMVRYPDAYWSINDVGLVANDFLNNANRKVMRAIEDVVNSGRDPEVPFVLEELKLAGEDGEYLTRLAQQPSSPVQGREYAGIVKGLSASRQLANAGARIIEVSREYRTDYARAIDEADAALRGVRDMLPRTERSPEPADILHRMRTQGHVTTVPIRFSPSLQRYTGGLAPGHFWVIGGFSSTGKSAVACNIADDALRERGRHVGIFSLEMTQEQYMLRLLSLRSGIGQRVLRDNALMPFDDHEKYKRAETELSRANLLVYDNVYTIEGIRAQAKRMKETQGLDVLVVDFIQNISVRGYDEFAAARESALELQRMAKDFNCTVVAFSQVSNEMAKANEAGTAGSFYSFKGHGSIRDAADVGIMLKRDLRNNSPTLIMDVVKNRHDERGPIYCQMDLPTGRIVEINPPEDEDE